MAAANASFNWSFDSLSEKELLMRSILLSLIGVPIPIIILIALFWH
jgi:hypothetical protein